MAEVSKLRVETGALSVDVEDERGHVIGSFSFNPYDNNIHKRYDEVEEFLAGLTIDKKETDAATNSLTSNIIASQFDYLLGAGVSDGIFRQCGPLTVTKSGDFFFKQVMQGVGALIESVTKKTTK